MENKQGLKKIKFYDWFFIIAIGSFIISFLTVFSDSLYIMSYTFIIIDIFSSLVFQFGIMYWMIKKKRYFLFLFSIFIFIIPVIYYFSNLRERFKEGDFQ